MAGSSLNPKMTPGLAPLPAAGQGTNTIVVNPAGGAQFDTIAAALAWIAASGLTAPQIIYVHNGTYSAPITIPDGTTLIGLGSDVEIDGSVTVPGGATFENISFSTEGSVAVRCNQPLNDEPSTLIFRACSFNATAGGTAILASGVELVFMDICNIDVEAATGISMTSATGDAATELIAQYLAIGVESAGTGIITADGDPAGDEMAFIEIGELILDVEDGGSVGIQFDNSGIPADPDELNGCMISSLTFTLSGGGDLFSVNNGQHTIGRLAGAVIDGTLIVADGGTVIVDVIDVPQAQGFTPAAFRVADIGSGFVLIGGGTVHGGTTNIFSFVGGAETPVLVVQGVGFTFEATGYMVDTDAAIDAITIQLFQCTVILTGDCGSVAKFAIDGSANPGVKLITLVDCQIDSSGPNDVIATNNTSVQLRGGSIVQSDNTNDCVNILAAAVVTDFRFTGGVLLDQAAGGAGRAITLVSDANMRVRQEGPLYFATCAPAEQLDIGAGAQTLQQELSGPFPAAASGFQSTGAAQDVLAAGWPAECGSLMIVQAIARACIGNGAGANDDSQTFEFTNNDAPGLGAATAVIPDSTVATPVTQTVALDAPRLVGPGQDVRLECTAVGANPPTDVQLRVA